MLCENGTCTFRTDEDIYRDALNVWGAQNRITKLFEEMAELTGAICHHMESRDTVEHIAEEIADVRIMLDQVEFLYQVKGTAERIRQKKLDRLDRTIMEVKK